MSVVVELEKTEEGVKIGHNKFDIFCHTLINVDVSSKTSCYEGRYDRSFDTSVESSVTDVYIYLGDEVIHEFRTESLAVFHAFFTECDWLDKAIDSYVTA